MLTSAGRAFQHAALWYPDSEGLEGQGRPGGMAVTPSSGGLGGLTLLQRSGQGGKPGDRHGDRDLIREVQFLASL